MPMSVSNPKALECCVPLCGCYGEQSHITIQCQKNFFSVQQRSHSMGETLITKVPNLRDYIAYTKEVRLVKAIMPNLKNKTPKQHMQLKKIPTINKWSWAKIVIMAYLKKLDWKIKVKRGTSNVDLW